MDSKCVENLGLTARAKAKRLTAAWSMRCKISKIALKGAQNGSHCPGNERCAVKIVADALPSRV